MSERFNGKTEYRRRSHGSARRGVFAVPSHDYLTQMQQSKRDKDELLAALREKQILKETQAAAEEALRGGLGNKFLPVFGYKHELLDTIEHNKATILMGATGSGKSTQVPQYLYEAGYDQVFILEPTRITADGIGERIQAELTEQLGAEGEHLVGIRHGGHSEQHRKNKITVMTPETFIRMGKEIQKEFKDKKVCIIPDEIHEDNEHTETAIGLAAVMTRDNENFRFVGSSATINPDAIKVPLGRITNPKDPRSVEVPVFKVEGKPYNVEIREEPHMTPAEAFLAFGEGHTTSILSTKGEKQIDAIISTIKTGLETRKPGSAEDIIFKKLSGNTSTLQRSMIEKLASNVPEGKRLVIVSSPAGRSGITIPGATFAATDAMINREIRDKDGYWGLITQYMSQAEIIQVLGRVGRDAPGAVGIICAPMPAETRNLKRIEEYNSIYPFKTMNEREEYPTPAILNANISGAVLEAAAIEQDYSELNKYMLTKLDDSVIQNVKQRLIETFGALDHDGKITEIGKLMDRFPVVAELSRGLAEAMQNGRSRQHLARAALIAASVDVGGLQHVRSNSEGSWRHLLKSGSDDDFIAQLDMMLGVLDAEKNFKAISDSYQFFRDYELSDKRVTDARKAAGKIMHRLGIDFESFEVEPPSYTEIADLREDFTAGMFDLVYRDAGMLGKERMYTHIRDNESARYRTISEGSVTEPASGQIIAGIPQYFENVIKGKVEIKNVIAMTLKVDPQIVGHFALQNHLVDYTTVKNSSRINGGMVLERENIMFGSLNVGSRDVSKSREAIPIESQRALVHYVLEHPGPAQLSLRSTAEELAEYRRILPADELEKYRQPQAPTDLTKSEIERLLHYYAERTRNAQELDRLLGEHSYQKNISIDRYYDDAARAEILKRSPATMNIGGVETTIYYDNGNPYVTRITKNQEAAINGPIYLNDGREVLVQVRKEGGRGTRRISFSELKNSKR